MTAATARSRSTVAPVDRTFRRLNAAILADLGKSIIEDAAILDGIPEGAMLVPLPVDADPEFIAACIAIGVDMIGKGHNVYFRHLARGEWGIDYERIVIDISTDQGEAQEPVGGPIEKELVRP